MVDHLFIHEIIEGATAPPLVPSKLSLCGATIYFAAIMLHFPIKTKILQQYVRQDD